MLRLTMLSRSCGTFVAVLGLCAATVVAPAGAVWTPGPRVAPPTAPAPNRGTATMKVIGSADAPVTITYRINGGPEQTETNVNLPWEKQYPVYDEAETSVTADAGAATLTCTITMDGMLAAFQTEAHPTCSFAYYG